VALVNKPSWDLHKRNAMSVLGRTQAHLVQTLQLLKPYQVLTFVVSGESVKVGYLHGILHAVKDDPGHSLYRLSEFGQLGAGTIF